jgi:hypothetical protein
MAKIKKIHNMVYSALVDFPSSRGDNFILILKVLENFVTPSMSLEAVMTNHAILGIPSIETITRCRRKIQAEHPELTNEEIKEIREKEEMEFINYAIDSKQ